MSDASSQTSNPLDVGAPAPRSEADRALAKRLLSDAKAGRDVRAAKVRRVRAAIKARTYENDLKLEVALGRLQEMVNVEEALLEETHTLRQRGRQRRTP